MKAIFAALALAVLAGSAPLQLPVTRIEHQQQMTQAEVKLRFEQGVVMLHAKQYEHAITALHRVLQLAPRMPEAHVNMGFALIGLGKADAALGFFRTAIELRPQQANAYYGLAMAADAQNDRETALGGMRAFVHLASPEDPHRAKARAALWEWQDQRDAQRAGVPVSGNEAAGNSRESGKSVVFVR